MCSGCLPRGASDGTVLQNLAAALYRVDAHTQGPATSPNETSVMRDITVASQIVYSPLHEIDQDVNAVVSRARELANLDLLAIWWSGDPRSFDEVTEACRSSGVRPFLWFPVLSDRSSPAASAGGRIVDLSQGAPSGRWPALGLRGEEFLFQCPVDEQIQSEVCDTLVRAMRGRDIDGVMLDRIRYPSPANGFETLFSCFCDRCQEAFRSRFGLSLRELALRGKDFLTRLRTMDRRSAEALVGRWTSFDDVYDSAGLKELAVFRCESVNHVVHLLARKATEAGIEIGLDLFSPALARLVGQDYGTLSRECRWIKPMLYRFARGPAGLPLEIDCFAAGLQSLCPRLPLVSIEKLATRVFGLRTKIHEPLPPAMLDRELTRIEAWGRDPATGDPLTGNASGGEGAKIYAGIETIVDPAYAVDVDPAELRESLSHLRSHCDGVVASWNLLRIPEENLRVLGQL